MNSGGWTRGEVKQPLHAQFTVYTDKRLYDMKNIDGAVVVYDVSIT